ncbi:LacI family DNA-binding transcriptional regulator [Curtobacterium sp. 22159]|uniref:LacI family DNA-binding transcriptional regulator n=1 Tax=Curtobacterium sp. 22159 TaxID=3453882 RepID=UPI003F829DEA
MSRTSARLSDVAREAGVSLSTASKALRGGGRISDATRDRVRAAAARLDFRPDALARSFAEGRSGIVGVLTRRATNTFARPVTIGAVLQLGDQHRAALVYDGDVATSGAMRESIRELQARRIDGLLVIGDGHEQETPSVTAHFDVPVTYVFAASDDPDDVMWLPDNHGAGALATGHLVERGARRIVHVTGPADSIAVQRREVGMLDALGPAALVAPVRRGDWSRAWGAAAARDLLDAGVAFDGVVCGNDHIAFGVLGVLAAAGVRVPEDVQLVGADNWEEVAMEGLERRRELTSVDFGLMQLGRLGAADLVDPAREPGERLAPVRLVAGGSTR